MQKRCPGCKEARPLDAYGANRKRPDGLALYCRPCVSAKNAAFYASNAEAMRARSTTYRLENPEKHAAATAAWRKANAQQFKEMHKAWRAANPDHVRAKRMRNYSESRAQELAKAREWKMANPAACQALIAKRNAAKFRAIPSWENLTKITQIYVDARTVSMCEGQIHHVDHIVPLQGKTVCGLHCEANLQIIPGSANQSKGNRHWPGQPVLKAA